MSRTRVVGSLARRANAAKKGSSPLHLGVAVRGAHEFLLRSERSGTGRGRIYTITYSVTDASGNTTLRQKTVTVPR